MEELCFHEGIGAGWETWGGGTACIGRGLVGLDVSEESFGVHGNGCLDCGRDQGCGPERFHELCGGEYWSEVLWVYCLISVTSLFKVDVSSSS